jgi:hypothetical protein
MLALAIAGVVLAVLGIAATVFVTVLVDKRTTKMLERINNMQVAEMPQEKYRTVLRLLDDMERSKVKRGTVSQLPNGSWSIDFIP